MLKLKKPTLSGEQVYKDCVSTVKNIANKNRLLACSPLIVKAETEFKAKITKGKMWTIKRESSVNLNVTPLELKKIYTDQMLKKELGRSHYKVLLDNVTLGICPLCAHREATNLDHYLPKTLYPRLVVLPINLIPSCKDCNTGKLSKFPKTAKEETLHPYFDDIEKDLWLKVSIKRTDPVSVEYYVVKAAGWDDLLFGRVKYHFESYLLKQLYAVQAARKLVTMKRRVTEIFSAGGTAALKRYLSDEAKSVADANLNSWEASLLRALKNDHWFCSQGFKQI